MQSYYLSDLLKMIGITNSITRQKFNVGLSCWGLINAVVLAFLVLKFRRRVMYMGCVMSLLCVYVAWTIAFSQSMKAIARDTLNHGANVASVFFIFAYSPCYNMG